jgi:adenylate cyclase
MPIRTGLYRSTPSVSDVLWEGRLAGDKLCYRQVIVDDPSTRARMIRFSRQQISSLLHGIGLRQVRLGCGLILLLYLISHFLNHALGNISLQALADGVHYHVRFWQYPPVAVAFYAAALVHSGLGLWVLYSRRQFRWHTAEPLQLVSGLIIPALVSAHVTGLRLGQTLFGQQKLYPQVLYAYVIAAPSKIWLLSAVLVMAWIHGCIGLYFWLRMKRFYQRAAPFLLATAVLIPTLSLLGLYQGARSVAREAAGASWKLENLSPRLIGTTAEQSRLDQIAEGVLICYLGLVGAVLLARCIRVLGERRGGMIALSYGNGRTVRVPKGLSVLEASLRHHVPHASACGGRARCSTCRIRVIGDYANLPEPSPRETFVLNRVGAGADPAIRLACQLRPETDLSFLLIFQPRLTTAGSRGPAHLGEERYLVSLFVDMRGSTRLAEHRLPFDTVFIVNRFLGAASKAVIDCGGQPNQFLGDGELALFGLSTSPATACRQALKAAARIAADVDELNHFLSHELREPIRFGIGIHAGEVIIGDIGYRDHMVFTALGDAVNVAARLQDMTKTLGCEAVISDEVFVTAGVSAVDLPRQAVAIRGRTEPITVRCVGDVSQLSDMVGDAVMVAAL